MARILTLSYRYFKYNHYYLRLISMRRLYTTVFYLALPFILLRAAWKAHRAKDNFKRMWERLGFYSSQQETSSLWLHAVSYGEAVAAEPLIKALQQGYPNFRIVVTTMTFTGANRVKTTFKDDEQILHLYLPYDVPSAMVRFFNHIQPLVGIIMETELWPNLLYLAGKHKLPLLIANARLSPRSYKGYQRIVKFMAPFLNNLYQVCAQTEEDADRFKGLGLQDHQVSIFGNLKFDITPPSQQIQAGALLKKQLPFELVWVAASTHANEEEQLLDLYTSLKKIFPSSLLILVPRHPQRFDEVASLCRKKGHSYVRRSEQTLPTSDTSVLLGDTMGELYFFYALADVAFVGGSLVPIGGHNLLEPAALKLPIVTGPHLFNFTAISHLLQKTGTLHQGARPEELHAIFTKLFSEKTYREEIGAAGFKIIAENQGATERHLQLISSLVPQ